MSWMTASNAGYYSLATSLPMTLPTTSSPLGPRVIFVPLLLVFAAFPPRLTPTVFLHATIGLT